MPDTDQIAAPPPATEPPLTRKFVVRILFILVMIGVTAAAIKLATLFLMITGSVVVAVIIHLISDPLHKRLGIGNTSAITIAILTLLVIILGAAWLFGSQIMAQSLALADQLPRSTDALQQRIAGTAVGDMVAQAWQSAGDQAGAAFSYAQKLVGNILGSLVSMVVIIVSGFILAAKPVAYRDGLLLLFPPHRRGRLRSVMNASGRALKGWMIGQLISMLVVGALTSIGLLLVGVPSWLILGLLAGFAQFVPLVGPIISAVPGLVIAASMGWVPLTWALVVYIGVQQLESNFLTPFVMNRTTSLPMVLTLFSILAFTTLFGPIGAIFATPITVVLFVAVQMLYIKDQLGDDLKVKGEEHYLAGAGK